MASYFISDLHLHESRPEVTRAFFNFLSNHAQGADALYLLGDIFEAWIGDDDDAELATEVRQALKTYASDGHPLFFMRGNRDFLVGDVFCADTGATLLEDPTLIDLYGTPSLLMHGDTLCTDDVDYIAFRKQARDPAWQGGLLSQPLAVRRQLAAQLRAQSASLSAMKAEDIMDVNAQEVARVLTQHQCLRLIHGHTHRPKRHTIEVNGQAAERIVLGDWHHQLWYLRADASGLELVAEGI